MPTVSAVQLRPPVRATLRRLRLHGWSFAVAGLSTAGLAVLVALGVLAPVLLGPGRATLRPTVARLVGVFADLHRWMVGSTLHDEQPDGYGSAPFDPRGLHVVRASGPTTTSASTTSASGPASLRGDVAWLAVSVPTGFLTALLVGVLPVVCLTAVSLPPVSALAGQPAVPGLTAASDPVVALVAMVVGIAGLLLWWWGAPRGMRVYALLSRRLLGAAATAAVTAYVRQRLAALAAQPKQSAALARLTPREREVLALVAEGRTNAAIAARLFITEKAVDKHLSNVFRKLDLPASAEDNRRVLAVLAYHRQ